MKKIKSKWGDTLESICWSKFGSYDMIYEILSLNQSLIKYLYIPTGSTVFLPNARPQEVKKTQAQKRFMGETEF